LGTLKHVPRFPLKSHAPITLLGGGLSDPVEWAKQNRNEWDFSNIKSEERGMAVAWEYGREYLKDFNSWHVYRSFLKKNERF